MEKIKQYIQKNQARITMALSFIGVYLLATGISLAIFSFARKSSGVSSTQVGTTRSKIDQSLPKTEECPINGQKYTKAERDIWEGRRPATVMIENHSQSTPPSPLSPAAFF